MTKEIWDSYHRDGTPAGVDLVRGRKIPNGLYHMICTVAVTGTDGSVLLVQRDRHKSYGGMWEASAGGSALKGESPEQCAMRELREETGIDGSGMKSEGFYTDDRFRSIIYEFSLTTDVPKDSVKLQEGETQAYRWVPRQEFAEMMRSRSKWNISPRSRHFGYRIIKEAEDAGLIPRSKHPQKKEKPKEGKGDSKQKAPQQKPKGKEGRPAPKAPQQQNGERPRRAPAKGHRSKPQGQKQHPNNPNNNRQGQNQKTQHPNSNNKNGGNSNPSNKPRPKQTAPKNPHPPQGSQPSRPDKVPADRRATGHHHKHRGNRVGNHTGGSGNGQ